MCINEDIHKLRPRFLAPPSLFQSFFSHNSDDLPLLPLSSYKKMLLSQETLRSAYVEAMGSFTVTQPQNPQ